MITREEALEKADRWLNGDAPAEHRHEVGIYEFDYGYVVWAVEPEPDDPTAIPEFVGSSRRVIDKQTGELTTWPSIPVQIIAEQYSARHGGGGSRTGETGRSPAVGGAAPSSQQVLPFYLVCDESRSMEGPPIEAINRSLPQLHREIGSNPVVADKTRFCVIGFSHEAEVLLPLSDLSEVTAIPALEASDGTNYGAAFNLLHDTIEHDVAALKADQHQVLRPAVFFLSDGRPDDVAEWPAAHRRVTDTSWGLHPNIVAFGFGDADPSTMQQVANVRAFLADDTFGPAEVLGEFAQSLTRSITMSSSSMRRDGGLNLVMPDTVPGFTTIESDII